MKIEIRLLKDTEYHLVNDLYNSVYNNKRPFPFFEWEFLNSPAGKAIYVVALDTERAGNQIIGTQCAIPVNMITGDGKIIRSAKSEDTYVSPQYRGLQLFEKMYQLLFEKCKEEGMKFIWGFTYAKKPFAKIGFELPFESSQGIFCVQLFSSFKYLSKLNPANSFFDKVKIFFACLISQLKSMQFYSIKENMHLSDRVISKQLNDKTELFKRAVNGDKDKLFICQEKEYTAWRISNNPYGNNYHECYLEDEEKNIVGNIIFNIRPEGFAYICQILFDAKLSLNDRKEFLKIVIRKILLHKVYLIRFWGFESNKINRAEIELLESLGFLFIKKGTTFVFKKLTETNDENISANNILLSRIFSQGNN